MIYVKGTTQIEKETITREVIKEWFQFHATGYSANDPLQGTTNIMYSGRRVYTGAIAADFSVLPLGTKVEIKEMGFYVVEDCGGLIKGNKIDIYCNTKEEALTINKDVWVRIINN